MIDDNNVELKWFVTHYKGGQKSEPVLMCRFRNVYSDNSYVGEAVKPRWGEWEVVQTETVLSDEEML